MNAVEKPIRPGDYDCCESGCCPCIWDVYYEELAHWKEMQAEKPKEGEEPAVANVGQRQE